MYIRWTNRPGSLVQFGGTITRGIPLQRGPNISHIQSTNERAVFWQQISEVESKGNAFHIQWNLKVVGNNARRIKLDGEEEVINNFL